MSDINRIVVHCSESTWGSVEAIRKWHVQGNGWKDIGYNAVILNGRTSSKKYSKSLDGVLEIGRGLDFDAVLSAAEVGAHAYGFNGSSIGICLVGNKEFSAKQFETLFTFCRLWNAIVPGIEIVGHTELDSKKSCPNFDVSKFREFLSFKDPKMEFYKLQLNK